MRHVIFWLQSPAPYITGIESWKPHSNTWLDSVWFCRAKNWTWCLATKFLVKKFIHGFDDYFAVKREIKCYTSVAGGYKKFPIPLIFGHPKTWDFWAPLIFSHPRPKIKGGRKLKGIRVVHRCWERWKEFIQSWQIEHESHVLNNNKLVTSIIAFYRD